MFLIIELSVSLIYVAKTIIMMLCRGRVVNIYDSYSGCPGFKSLPGDRLY
jgi:hypothetical protein